MSPSRAFAHGLGRAWDRHLRERRLAGGFSVLSSFRPVVLSASLAQIFMCLRLVMVLVGSSPAL